MVGFMQHLFFYSAGVAALQSGASKRQRAAPIGEGTSSERESSTDMSRAAPKKELFVNTQYEKCGHTLESDPSRVVTLV